MTKNPIIFKASVRYPYDVLKKFHKNLLDQYKTGIIVIPKTLDLVAYPSGADTVEIECEDDNE